MFSILNKWLDTNTKTIHLRNIYEKDISPPTNSFKIEEQDQKGLRVKTNLFSLGDFTRKNKNMICAGQISRI